MRRNIKQQQQYDDGEKNIANGADDAEDAGDITAGEPEKCSL